jgi:hypothetical protein
LKFNIQLGIDWIPASSLTAGGLLAVKLGLSLTLLTIIVVVAILPPKPLSSPVWEACTSKLPSVLVSVVGVNLSPALPSSTVMKSPLLMIVAPSFLYKVPYWICVILKWLTSIPSSTWREIFKPEVVWVSSSVSAGVMVGVSAIGTIVIVTVLVSESTVPSLALNVKKSLPLKSVVGV